MKNSYQKLKDKNAELTLDIFTLIGEDGFLKQQEIKLKYSVRAELEKVIWGGSLDVRSWVSPDGIKTTFVPCPNLND